MVGKTIGEMTRAGWLLAAVATACLGIGLRSGTAQSAPADDGPLSPAEATSTMTVPEGFQVTLFAGEPDLVQPIAMAFDARGRLFVVECLSYPEWTKDGSGHDRVVILEDTDHDGRMDRRTVFWDQGSNLSGIEVGWGGVWLCATPKLVFVPDRDGDDVPDGPAETVLDGWDLEARHNVFNSLIWGPDGWLYGTNGILSNSRVGVPGTPDDQRVALNCGVWRVHPHSRRFEAVAHGTTNPWGLDYDDWGQMFMTNCVIKHLFQVIPGGRYDRMYGQDLNPFAYTLIPSCADHIHWGGGYWDTEGVDKPENDALGGGHAHSGALVYLGDNWPQQYRNGLLTVNIHGRRINHDRFEPTGSGVVAHHESDVLRSADPWFRGVALKSGPDGGVYLADWNDTGECHDAEEVSRENGRIFKITWGAPKSETVDLNQATNERLAELQLHANDWYVRQARLELAHRASLLPLFNPNLMQPLRRLATKHAEPARRLRGLWCLNATNNLSDDVLRAALDDPHEQVRAWGVRLAVDSDPAPALPDRLAALARSETSQRVRLELAAGLQRLPLATRLEWGTDLVAHAEDAADSNLPPLLWYGLEPVVAASSQDAVTLLARCRIPQLRKWSGRRLTEAGRLDDSLALVQGAPDESAQAEVLTGILDGLHGRRKVAQPKGWTRLANTLAAAQNPAVARQALFLGTILGDPTAALRLADLVRDPAAAAPEREAALSLLIQQDYPSLGGLLTELLDEPTLRGASVRGLAAINDPSIAPLILARYSTLTAEERADAVNTLAARVPAALALLTAVERGVVARQEISPFTARQILSLGDERVTAQLEKVWGQVKPAAEGKAELVARFKASLTPSARERADLRQGRALFTRQCASCHRLFDTGGAIGPELTGSQRTNLDYILDNVLDPSAVVPREYKVTLIETDDGRVLNGIVQQENSESVTLRTLNDVVVVPLTEIVTREPSELSMMPEGLFTQLSEAEVLDLVSYLASPTQVP